MILTMWGFGASFRKEAGASSFPSAKSSSPTKRRRRGNGITKASSIPARDNPRNRSHNNPNQLPNQHPYDHYTTGTRDFVSTPVSMALSDETVSISDTHLGIEVSLDDGNTFTAYPPPLSYEDYLGTCRKVYRSQFSINYAVIDNKATWKKVDDHIPQPNNKKHEVPLFGRGLFMNDDIMFDDATFLLQSYVAKEEQASLEREMKLLKLECKALEQDSSGIRIPEKALSDTWDIDLLLKERLALSLTPNKVDELQKKRGRCWTIQIRNQKSRDALCAQLGYNISADTKRRSGNNDTRRLTLTPNNCRESHNLRQLTIQAPVTDKIAIAIFVTRDTGKAWGHVPDRLFQRLKKERIGLNSIEYLSSGPGGSYFCELSSGHTWWGSSDIDFLRLVNEWKVARVAFGATRHYGSETAHSWIMVGRDGRVAWKNIPARLHNKLELRLVNNPTLAEITLGPEDSYFVRFLDGSVDYCLPATISSVCESIERDGGKITNVILREDSSHDFVIRHAER